MLRVSPPNPRGVAIGGDRTCKNVTLEAKKNTLKNIFLKKSHQPTKKTPDPSTREALWTPYWVVWFFFFLPYFFRCID